MGGGLGAAGFCVFFYRYPEYSGHAEAIAHAVVDAEAALANLQEGDAATSQAQALVGKRRDELREELASITSPLKRQERTRVCHDIVQQVANPPTHGNGNEITNENGSARRLGERKASTPTCSTSSWSFPSIIL